MANFDGPESKRRKTEPEEDGWDADDDFSQAELENIDHIILSQHPAGTVEQNNNGGAGKNNTLKPPSKPRVVGRGTSRSFSANELYKSPSAQIAQRKTLSKPQVQFLPNTSKTRQNKGEPVKANGTKTDSFPNSVPWTKPQTSKNNDNKMEQLNKEIQRLKAITYTAEGKVKMLEQNVQKKDHEINKLRQEKIQHHEEETQQRTEKEKRFERENEKLRTELEFKQQEVMELQRHIRQERASHLGGDGQNSKLKSPQPNRKLVQSPATPNRGFPTKQTFLADARSPEKLQTKERPGTSTRPRKERKMRLQCRQSNVSLQTSGPELVSKLLGGSGSDVTSPEGLFRLLQAYDVIPEQQETSNGKPTKPAVTFSGNEEHHALAMQAISTLLSSSSLEHSGDAALLLLPLLETHIVRYMDSFFGGDSKGGESKGGAGGVGSSNNSNNSDPTSSSHHQNQRFNELKNTTTAINTINRNAQQTGRESRESRESRDSRESSRSPTMEDDATGTGELSAAFASALNLGTVERYALDSLCRLEVLVRHSPHVRRALVAMADPSAPDTHASSSSSSQTQPGESRLATPLPASCRARIIRNCALFRCLLRLADPLTQQQLRRGTCKIWPLSVSTASIRVLATLAQLIDRPQQLLIFEPAFSPALWNCLEDISMDRLPLLAATLDLLTALVKSEKLVKMLCVNSGECLLLSAYHCIIHIPTTCPLGQRRNLKYKLLLLLSSIVKEYGTEALLSDCECGQEVVKCLVLMLYNELPLHDTHKPPSPSSSSSVTSPPGIRSLRSVIEAGVVLLHALSVGGGGEGGGGDRGCLRRRRRRGAGEDVDHCYVQLMFAYEELVDAANTDETDPLGSMISDLWDFDHPLPWEIWLDEEEDQAMEQN